MVFYIQNPSRIHPELQNSIKIHLESIPNYKTPSKSISNPFRIPKLHQNPSQIHPKFQNSIKIHLESIPNSKTPSKSISNPPQIPKIHQNPSQIYPTSINFSFSPRIPVRAFSEASRRRVTRRSARARCTTRPRQGFQVCAKRWPSELRRCPCGECFLDPQGMRIIENPLEG